MHMSRNSRTIIFFILTAGLGISSAIPFTAADVEADDMLVNVEGPYSLFIVFHKSHGP